MNTTTQPGPLEVRLSDQLGLVADALRRAYYRTELGGWRGPEVDEDERWLAVAQAAQDAGRRMMNTPNVAGNRLAPTQEQR